MHGFKVQRLAKPNQVNQVKQWHILRVHFEQNKYFTSEWNECAKKFKQYVATQILASYVNGNIRMWSVRLSWKHWKFVVDCTIHIHLYAKKTNYKK